MPLVAYTSYLPIREAQKRGINLDLIQHAYSKALRASSKEQAKMFEFIANYEEHRKTALGIVDSEAQQAMDIDDTEILLPQLQAHQGYYSMECLEDLQHQAQLQPARNRELILTVVVENFRNR